jgi:hypothetical protein
MRFLSKAELQERDWRTSCQRDAAHCVRCRAPIPAGDAVAVRYQWHGRFTPNRIDGAFGGWNVFCLACGPKGEPNLVCRCEGCNRTIQIFKRANRRGHRCCSQLCRWRAVNRQRSSRHAHERRKRCPVCRVAFVASRRDAVTCGSRCRQKRYREAAKIVETEALKTVRDAV